MEGGHFNIIGVGWGWGEDLFHKVPVCLVLSVSWSVLPSVGICGSRWSSGRKGDQALADSLFPSWVLRGVANMMSSIN